MKSIGSGFRYSASLSAIIAGLQLATAHAQTLVPAQIPLADTQCSGNAFNPLSACTVTGTRTHSTPVVTIAPLPGVPGQSTITHTESVSFDGQLQIGGAMFPTAPDSFFGLPAQFLFPADAARVDAALSYTGNSSFTTSTTSAPFVAASLETPFGQFGRYDIDSLDVRSIGVDLQNRTVERESGNEYTFSIASADPQAVTDNSTALAGKYHGTDDSGALVFGKIAGSATVIAAEQNSAVVTASPFALNPDGSPSNVFVSPLAIAYDVSTQETTRLDENGLTTLTVAVTDGIDMNDSRISNLGAAIESTDAVNLGQVQSLITSNSPIRNSEGDGSLSGGSGSSASGDGAVALGQGQQATGNGAVAIGDPNVATGTGAVAIGANNTAIGDGAVALGSSSLANGAGNVALGLNAMASASNAVALGANAVANQANTVSVGAAGAERRVVNVAGAVAATDAVNKAQLDAEVAQRAAAEAVLQTRLQAEATARAQADVRMRDNLAAETTIRVATDAALQANINNEAAVRASADRAEANARAAADNRLQGQINTLGSNLFSLTGRVTTLERTVAQDRKDSRQGIASAVAMTAAPMPSAPGKVAYSVNVANFRDEQAVAASLAMRLNGPNTVAITAGLSYGGGENTAMRVGVAGEF